MNKLKYLPLTLAFAIFAGHCAAQQVPPTQAKALDQSVITFPQNDGKVLLLLIGFSHKSEKECDKWNDRLKPGYLHDSHLAYYELADFQGVPSFVMRFILHGLRRAVPKDEHAHFIPFYSGEAEWKKLVSYSAPEDAYLVVADPAGYALWQTHGPPDDNKYSELQAALTKATSRP
jgi:hypothetical protein